MGWPVTYVSREGSTAEGEKKTTTKNKKKKFFFFEDARQEIPVRIV